MCVCVCVCVLVAQSCPTLCDHMDCSLPNFSVLGISPARILEWIAFPFPRGSGSLQTCWTAFTSQAPSGDCPGYLQKQSASLPKSEQPVFSILNLGIKRQSCWKQSTGVSTALKASRAGRTAQHSLRPGKLARMQPHRTKKEGKKEVQILFPKVMSILFPSFTLKSINNSRQSELVRQ